MQRSRLKPASQRPGIGARPDGQRSAGQVTGFIDERDDLTPLPRESWLPAPYDPRDVGAIKACLNGTAQPHQQQRAMRWILYASGRHISPYDPGSQRNTDHACGKAWIGEQILKLSRVIINTSNEQGQ